MVGNKIVPDESRAGNENRAHVGRAGIYNQTTPMTSDGGVSGTNLSNAMPEGILRGDSVPMTLDPHANARHSNENRTLAPGERARSKETAEIHRRLKPDSGVGYK
jgi:hypothetical protein